MYYYCILLFYKQTKKQMNENVSLFVDVSCLLLFPGMWLEQIMDCIQTSDMQPAFQGLDETSALILFDTFSYIPSPASGNWSSSGHQWPTFVIYP